MRPVGSPNPFVEAVLLELELILSDEFLWCHADVLNVANLVPFRKASIMHGATVPEHKVTRLHVDFDHLAAPVLKPLKITGAEKEQVHILHLWRWGILMGIEFPRSGEELFKELGRTLHQH